MDICRKKLNNSIMPSYENKASLESYILWFYNTTGGACDRIWTPISDDKTEGEFFNMNDGSEATFLPWDDSEPNGGLDENHVRVDYPGGLYKDIAAGWPGVCGSCVLHTSLVLQLDGLCDHSYIGLYLILICL